MCQKKNVHVLQKFVPLAIGIQRLGWGYRHSPSSINPASLIGGVDVINQGFTKSTADLDFWYNPTITKFS